ncbi:MAG: metallophosphoesterase [Hyphomicrobiales bacterium]|nr:metallophosphoesterase [Hyphomicrobiales bacterium]
MRLYAIGDVHGRFDLLEAMHERIHGDIAARRPADWRIIHLGDYTDRGPSSKGVLDFLIAARARDHRVISLMGNHDLGLLEFLAEPSPYDLFATNGGEETARSYGVELRFSPLSALTQGHAKLRNAVPEEHVAFLRSLPRFVTFGDFFFCHAGIRPGVKLERQDPHDLIWIRHEFLDHRGLYEKVVVHGHTPSDEPEIMPNQINVDTGAFYSGVLTCAIIDGPDKMLMDVRGAPDLRY